MKKTELKKKIKHYAPEIFVGASLLAGIAAVIYIKNDIQDKSDDNFVLEAEMLRKLNQNPAGAWYLQTDIGNYKLTLAE